MLARFTSRGGEFAQKNPRALKALKILVVLGVIRRVNAWLNRRALNNGVSDHYDWNREVVVVTGGSNGIGKQIAERLGNCGIKVAVLDIQPPKDELPSTVRFYECDITSSATISDVAGSIRSTLGEPTVLINNAGICTGTTILGTSEAQNRKVFEINTLSHYRLAREFLPSIIDRNHGMVVTVASQAGYMTTPNMTDYSATKSAAISFHEGLTAELVARYKAPRVRTVLVTQGFVKTALIRVLTPENTWLQPLLYPETVAEQLVDQVLTGTSGHIVVPGSSGWIAKNLRSFPWWFQHRLRIRAESLMRGPG